MLREVTIVEARKNFGDILNEVKYRHDNIIIKKSGKPIAALIDVELFERVKMLRDHFSALTTELSKAYEDEDTQRAEEEIKEALKSAKGQ